MKTATITWVDDIQFSSKSDSGHSVLMDAGGLGTPDNTAPTPVEMVLMSLGVCSGVGVIKILKKKKRSVEAFRVDLKARQAETQPKVFEEIWVKLVFRGDMADKHVKSAIDLVSEKYCSIGAMLKKSAKIHYEWEINPQ